MTDAQPVRAGASAADWLRGSGTVAGTLQLPDTLHGQLFLLAYDRRRNRVDGADRWRFGLALRTAILTELYLAGHLRDEDGRPCPVGITRPDDPLLGAALHDIGATEPPSWMHAVARDQRRVPGLVCSQLEVAGWLWVQRCRVFGLIPSTRLRLRDHDLVGALADRVAAALRDAIADRPADEKLFAVGLIGALGELPTVFGFDEALSHCEKLEQLVDRAIPPITGMRRVIDMVHGRMSANDVGYAT